MIENPAYREDIASVLSAEHPWNRLDGRNVLVTGATGAVGSLLVDTLMAAAEEHGFGVVAMSRGRERAERLFSVYCDCPNFRTVSADVTLPFRDVDCDIAFHLASNSHPFQYSTDPIGTIRTNIIGLENVLKMPALSSGGRVVFASSVEVYGENRGDVDSFDEEYCGYIDCNTVRAGYNESKRLGETLCRAYGKQRGIDFVIPRLSRLYGPTVKEGDSKAVSQFIRNAVDGEDIVLKSAGNQLFSYCYVADAVSALLFLLFRGESGEAYNVAGDRATLRDIAGMLADIAGTKVVFDTPDDTESEGYSVATKAVLSTEKIRRIGWSPQTGLREGLERTVGILNGSGSPARL